MVEKLNFEWKIYGTIACLFDNVLNQKIIKNNKIFNWFLIWFELLVFSDVNGLYSRSWDYSKICKVQTLNFMVKKMGEKNDIK